MDNYDREAIIPENNQSDTYHLAAVIDPRPGEGAMRESEARSRGNTCCETCHGVWKRQNDD